MEKVKIVSVSEIIGKDFVNVIATNSKGETLKGSSYNKAELTGKEGQEFEMEVKPAKEYNGVMQYYFSLPKSGGGKTFAPKNHVPDMRMCALNNAVASCVKIEGAITTANVLKLADLYFGWLNTK